MANGILRLHRKIVRDLDAMLDHVDIVPEWRRWDARRRRARIIRCLDELETAKVVYVDKPREDMGR